MPELRAACPLAYQRPTLEELRSGDVRPYLFGGQQRPNCTQCAVSSSSFTTTSGPSMLCLQYPKEGCVLEPIK